MEVGVAPLLLLHVCLCGLATAVLDEGDVCKRSGGEVWRCEALRSCRGAQLLLQDQKRPLMCNSRKSGADSVVCCPPNRTSVSALASAPGAKSHRKCLEYSEAVFTVLPDQNVRLDNCAAVEPLITKGKNAEAREYPHMALIGFGQKPRVKWGCGGSLISSYYVLSAAHCTDTGMGLANWVRLGEYNLNSMSDDRTGQSQPDDYQIVKRVNHHGYNGKNTYDDIALYRLDRRVSFNEYVRPACIHTERTFAQSHAIATGWGHTKSGGRRSDVLQKGNLTIASSRACRDDWNDGLISAGATDGLRDESQMCAGDLKHGVDTCQGDSGGPLQLRLRTPYCMYGIIGVTSFGSGCGGKTLGVYTRLSHYVSWIESIVWP